MEIEKLRKKSEKELYKMLVDLRKSFTDKSLEMRMGKLKNLREPRNIRKDMAKIMTMLKEKDTDKLSKKDKNGKTKA